VKLFSVVVVADVVVADVVVTVVKNSCIGFHAKPHFDSKQLLLLRDGHFFVLCLNIFQTHF